MTTEKLKFKLELLPEYWDKKPIANISYSEPWASQQRQAGNALTESFKNVTNMGHNGRWELGYASPFYMWLLENLY